MQLITMLMVTVALTGLACSADSNKNSNTNQTKTQQPTPDHVTTGKTIDALGKKVSNPVTSPECTKIRKAIETRDFSGWKGLPASCQASDLFDNMPADVSDRPRRMLGKRGANWVLLKLDGYYRPMASFVDGKFVMFDSMNPTLAVSVTELEKQLGKPAATTDWWYGSVEMKASAHVYPSSGITLFLNSNTSKVLHIALYHPTDLAGWEQNLRPRLRKKRHGKTK